MRALEKQTPSSQPAQPRKAEVKMEKDRSMRRKTRAHLSVPRATRLVIFSIVAFMVTTWFLLAACSAPQNQSGQSSTQQSAAMDWKSVETAIGKAGTVQP